MTGVQILEIRGRVQTMSGPVDVLLDFDEVSGHAVAFLAQLGDEDAPVTSDDDHRIVLDEQTKAQIHMALESACAISTS